MIYIKTTMGCLSAAESGFHPARRALESRRSPQSGVCSDTWNSWKRQQRVQIQGVCSPKKAGYPAPHWAHTHAMKWLVPEAGRWCICLARRQHRERLKSCQTECDLQSATLMVKGSGVNYLAFPFYWGWMRAGRRDLPPLHPQWHPTVYTTRAECHKRGASFTGGPHAKETPIRS